MRIRPLVHSVCAAVVSVGAAFSIFFAAGLLRPLEAVPQAQAAQKPAAAPATAPQAAPKPATPPVEMTAAQAYKNVQVLKDVPQDQFLSSMFVIAASLGVGCDHCHVGSDTGAWPMEKDDKKAKLTARDMMKMMRGINDQFFGGQQEVTCATCHQGHLQPSAFVPVRQLGEKQEGEVDEAQQKSLPTADSVLDSYVSAIGGASVLGKLTTREAKGTMTSESGETYSFLLRQKSPNHMFFSFTSAELQVSKGFDGEISWQKWPNGVFNQRGIEGKSIARWAELFVDADAKKRYPRRFVEGKETLEGHEVFVVRAGGPGDVSERLYFDASTGLLLRRIVLTRTALGRLPEETDFADYREVDGVKEPFTVRYLQINTRFTVKYTEIRHNVPLDDSIFQMPLGPK